MRVFVYMGDKKAFIGMKESIYTSANVYLPGRRTWESGEGL